MCALATRLTALGYRARQLHSTRYGYWRRAHYGKHTPMASNGAAYDAQRLVLPYAAASDVIQATDDAQQGRLVLPYTAASDVIQRGPYTVRAAASSAASGSATPSSSAPPSTPAGTATPSSSAPCSTPYASTTQEAVSMILHLQASGPKDGERKDASVPPSAQRKRPRTMVLGGLCTRWMLCEAALAHSSGWASMSACYFEPNLMNKILDDTYHMTLRTRRFAWSLHIH
jgi:hypothetical protein